MKSLQNGPGRGGMGMMSNEEKSSIFQKIIVSNRRGRVSYICRVGIFEILDTHTERPRSGGIDMKSNSEALDLSKDQCAELV